jgi:hypothetical protein
VHDFVGSAEAGRCLRAAARVKFRSWATATWKSSPHLRNVAHRGKIEESGVVLHVVFDVLWHDVKREAATFASSDQANAIAAPARTYFRTLNASINAGGEPPGIRRSAWSSSCNREWHVCPCTSIAGVNVTPGKEGVQLFVRAAIMCERAM